MAVDAWGAFDFDRGFESSDDDDDDLVWATSGEAEIAPFVPAPPKVTRLGASRRVTRGVLSLSSSFSSSSSLLDTSRLSHLE